MLESLFNKVAYLVPATLSKKTPTQVLSCKIRSSYFVDDLQTTGCETPVPGSLFNKVAYLAA